MGIELRNNPSSEPPLFQKNVDNEIVANENENEIDTIIQNCASIISNQNIGE